MRFTSAFFTLTVTALLAAPPAAGQERTPHGDHESGISPAPEALSRATRDLGRSLQRLRGDIHETNRWMIVHGTSEGLHDVGTEMAHAGEHLQELVRQLDEAYGEQEIAGDAGRRKSVDALQSEVRELERQLRRTLDALRRAVGYR
ncbi:MAG TPA: hypothetical protein VFM14_15670 [Gemmatimonadales bacterium]|nr:hypothetical protein [Gemmatimonadales bacterium]